MIYTMDKDQVITNYGGSIEESGFTEASIEASILKLSEVVKGWLYYDVVKRELINGEIITYVLDLDDEDNNRIATSYITIRPLKEQVDIEIDFN